MKPLLLLIIVLLATASHPAAAQNQPQLTLAIIPTSYSDVLSPDPSIVFDYTDHFHVLLTNNSEKPIVLFEEWNSWGYFGLSFDITYSDGRKVHSTKFSSGWDKNAASTVTIAPHGFYIFNVTFSKKEDLNHHRFWINSLFDEKGLDKGLKCRIRAVYSIENSPEAQREHAWIGTVTSEENNYTLWR